MLHPPDAPERNTMTVRLERDLANRLRDAARANDRSVNGEIQAAVREHLRVVSIEHDIFDSEAHA